MEAAENIKGQGIWTFIWTDQEGRELRRRVEKNKIVTSGLTAYAAILTGNLVADCAVYVGLGTGAVAPVAGDTTLGNETVRKIITTKTQDGVDIIYRFYLLTGEAVGDFTEWGVFLEATSATNSGRLLNKLVPVGGVSKASNENLTVEVRVTLTAA